MATPTIMPALEITEGHVYVLRRDTDVIGQAASVQPQSQVPTNQIARIGDTNQKTSYGATQHTLNIAIYSELDPDQLSLLLNGPVKPTTGGWVGDEQIYLNPSVAPFNLFLDVYDAATDGTDNLMGTWTFTNFKPSSLSFPVQANNVVQMQINGQCDSIIYTPAAGVGA